MNTLIKLRNSEEYTLISTYDRRHHRSHYFYLSNDKFCEWLNGCAGYFHDCDGSDFLTILPDNSADFRLNISWLTESYGELSGYIQRLTIPQDLLISVVRGDVSEASYLCSDTGRTKSKVVLSALAHRNVAEMPTHIRRAFSKFMRDHFDYAVPGRIEVYADGRSDFYFQDTGSGFNMNGGIILSTVDRRHCNGTNFCHRYSIHT